jgi:hypothetical protein
MVALPLDSRTPPAFSTAQSWEEPDDSSFSMETATQVTAFSPFIFMRHFFPVVGEKGGFFVQSGYYLSTSPVGNHL